MSKNYMMVSSYPIIHTSEAASVPETPGVYALENEVTGAIYVGCTVNLRARYKHWHSVRLRTEARMRNLCSPLLAEAFLTAPPEGWRFVVLVTSEGMSKEERLALEARAIERAIATKGAKCLNAEYGALYVGGGKPRYDLQ